MTPCVIGNRTTNPKRHTRGPSEIPCITCGFLFHPARRDSRYCGSRCKQEGYRRRKAASLPLAELELRHARLTIQIERDNRIAWENARQYFFPGWMPDSPKICITKFYGVGFFAWGRAKLAKKRIAALEARMRVLANA